MTLRSPQRLSFLSADRFNRSMRTPGALK